MLESFMDNWELILGVSSILFPFLLPAKIASKVNLVVKVLKPIVTTLEKMEQSKGGLSLESEFKEQVKEKAFNELSNVIASKTELFNRNDVKNVLTIVSNSKGVSNIKDKITDFVNKI